MIRCDAPGCRAGIVHPERSPSAFGEPCPTCKGQGELRLCDLARLLDEREATLKKLIKLRGRMRASTCRRILDKVSTIVWPAPKKQPELFA